jgi:hypothetical protein
MRSDINHTIISIHNYVSARSIKDKCKRTIHIFSMMKKVVFQKSHLNSSNRWMGKSIHAQPYFSFIKRNDVQQLWRVLFSGIIILCSPMKVNWYFQRYRLPPSSGLNNKPKKKQSSAFQLATQCYIPEDRIIQNHCCENLKPYINWWLQIKISSLRNHIHT